MAEEKRTFFSKRAVREELAYLQDTQMIGAILGGSMHIVYVDNHKEEL